jgi:hypothetical protein
MSQFPISVSPTMSLEGAALALVTAEAILISVEFGKMTKIVAKKSLNWLRNRAKPVFHRIMRWWGGKEKWTRIWEDYKAARSAIMKEESNDAIRLFLIQDLREEFRHQYPEYGFKWN